MILQSAALKLEKCTKQKSKLYILLAFLVIRDLGRIQTCNLLSRNQMRYSVAPRGLLRRQIYPILPSLQNYKARIVT